MIICYGFDSDRSNVPAVTIELSKPHRFSVKMFSDIRRLAYGLSQANISLIVSAMVGGDKFVFILLDILCMDPKRSGSV
jgi:hypothetical protein